MVKASCTGVVLFSIALAGLTAANAAPESPEGSTPALDERRVILLETPPTIKGPDVEAAQGLRIVYVNFDGVVLTTSNSSDNAMSNTTAIPVVSGFMGPGQTLNIPQFQPSQLGDNGGGLSRDQIISRAINQLYASHAPYNVEFVTERPASGTYSMVVVGSSCAGVTGMNGCGGIALLDCGDISSASNITFMFPPGLRVDDIASVAAQEAAHAFGLSHTNDQTDIMFPQIQQSIPTRFGSGNVPDTPNCGNSFQDSDALMLSTIGPRGQDTIPPAVEITSPANGATITPNATINATVTDNVLVSDVEFLVDGASVATQAAGPFVFSLPSTATAGPIDITVRATDSSGNTGQATISVTISADGSEGNLGELCSDSAQCDSQQCAALDGEMRCSRSCDASNPCPSGFECLGDVACWPVSGGCAVSSNGNGAGALLLLIALVGLARRRR